MKIALVGARGVVGTYSGIETYYEEVGSRLAARGHEVTAYCRTYFTPDVASHRGIRVRRLPTVRTKHLETLIHSLLSTADACFRGYDVVQYHAIGSAPLALVPRLVGTRTVVSVRGLDWQRAKWGAFARGVLRVGEWAAARCPDATVVVSETLRRHFETVHGRSPRVIPNAVAAGKKRPLELLAGRGLEDDGFLLFAGRLSPEKGVDDLLEALAPLEPLLAERGKKLVLAGDPGYSADYMARLRALAGERVVFLGRVGRREMEELYGACYAFVLPSAIEGLSIALLEALSHGNCLITTDIPENLEVVGDAGLSFPPGDVAALRAVLERVLTDPELVAERRARARERAAQQPDWDEVARRTETLYRELVGGRGR